MTPVDLAKDTKDTKTFLQNIKEEVKIHRLVILRDQHDLTAERFLDICSALGELDFRGFEQHSTSPSPFVLCVSNDATWGYKNVGTAGFHIDGGFLETPNEYSVYRIIKTPEKGAGTGKII